MTAEEKLQELYKQQEPVVLESKIRSGEASLHVTNSGSVYLAAEHIDLIANLVIERLNNGN